MLRPRARGLGLALAVLAALVGAPATFSDTGSGGDPVAREIARWQERIRSTTPSDDEAKEIRKSSAPLLIRWPYT